MIFKNQPGAQKGKPNNNGLKETWSHPGKCLPIKRNGNFGGNPIALDKNPSRGTLPESLGHLSELKIRNLGK